jgi:hypothetical protein
VVAPDRLVESREGDGDARSAKGTRTSTAATFSATSFVPQENVESLRNYLKTAIVASTRSPAKAAARTARFDYLEGAPGLKRLNMYTLLPRLRPVWLVLREAEVDQMMAIPYVVSARSRALPPMPSKTYLLNDSCFLVFKKATAP